MPGGVMTPANAASGWRRITAFGIDYLVLGVYIGGLTAASLAARRALRREIGPPATLRARLVGHAVALLTLTLPVVLYFAVLESSRWGGTFGKRALGLRLVTVEGRRVPLQRSLLRSAVKFAPWELAHTMLWHTPGWSLAPRPTAVNWSGFGLALLLSGGYLLALFGKARRAPYDRVAGTRVVTDSLRQGEHGLLSGKE
jgi:uncharacterized RDD family membrane protein YckC